MARCEVARLPDGGLRFLHAIFAFIVGCAGEEPYAPPYPTSFTAVQYSSTGGCQNCFRTVSVHGNPRLLMLVDHTGIEEFPLDDAEFNDVSMLVLSRRFVDEMRNPITWQCDIDAGLEASIAVSFDEHALAARVSDACYGRCNQADHPYMRLRNLLMDLKGKYLTCASNVLPAFCATFPSTPPAPAERMLCARCREDCGI